MLFLTLWLSVFTFAQADSISLASIPDQMDSIQLSVWKVYTKEMSSPGEEAQDYEKEIKRVTLSESDQRLLTKALLDPQSYSHSRALRYHYNLVFNGYLSGEVSIEIHISTLTGNIDIENKATASYFKNSCSAELGKLIIAFLNQYNLISLFDEYDLEGLLQQ